MSWRKKEKIVDYEIIENDDDSYSLKIDGKLFEYKGETEFDLMLDDPSKQLIEIYLTNDKWILIMPNGKLFEYKGITEFHTFGPDQFGIFHIIVEDGDTPIEIPAEDIIASIEEDEIILENKSYTIKEYAQQLLQQVGETTLTPKQYEFIKLYYKQIVEQKENEDKIVDLFLDLMLEERNIVC